MNVLLTGATGFLGSELLRALLLSRAVDRIVVLARPHAGMRAEDRLVRMREHWRKFVAVPTDSEWSRLEVIEHDLSCVELPRITSPITTVFHAAASTELGLPLGPSRRANLWATHRALQIARGLRGLERFVHFSTAYVCGKRRGLIKENDPAPHAFHNFYELTKRESEDAVHWGSLPYTILRPSIIVGRADDGYAYGTKVLYSVWRMWLSGLIPRAPIDPKAWVDIVPVDYVVRAGLHLAKDPNALGQRLHLCAGPGRMSPKTIMLTATEAFQVKRPPISPPWVAYALRSPPVRQFVQHGLREVLDAMYWHLPYLGIRGRTFDMSRSAALLAPAGISCPDFADYGPTLFRFCKETAWGKRPLKAKQQGLACSA